MSYSGISAMPLSVARALLWACPIIVAVLLGARRLTARVITLPSISLPAPAESVSLWLPYPTSVNRIWRSGKSRKGRTVVFTSAEYKAWLDEAYVAWLKQRNQLSVKSIKGRYSIAISANPPDKRHRDLGNLEKVVSDFLQMIAVIEDDSLAQEICLRWDTEDTPMGRVHVVINPYI